MLNLKYMSNKKYFLLLILVLVFVSLYFAYNFTDQKSYLTEKDRCQKIGSELYAELDKTFNTRQPIKSSSFISVSEPVYGYSKKLDTCILKYMQASRRGDTEPLFVVILIKDVLTNKTLLDFSYSYALQQGVTEKEVGSCGEREISCAKSQKEFASFLENL